MLNPGDTILVPDPGYPDYWSGVTLAKAKMEMMPLVKDRAFLPDYSSITAEIREQAKLMYLNYPNNPTGAVATSEFFEDTVRFAAENGICVVHDFAYGAVGFDGCKPLSFLQTEGAKDIGIEIYTLSKTYNMAGWRVALPSETLRSLKRSIFIKTICLSVFSERLRSCSRGTVSRSDVCGRAKCQV